VNIGLAVLEASNVSAMGTDVFVSTIKYTTLQRWSYNDSALIIVFFVFFVTLGGQCC
jgi:hypothetical protein